MKSKNEVSPSKVFWNDADYVALARAALHKFPKRNLRDTPKADDLDLTPDEFHSVMKRALPRPRHRPLLRPHRYKAQLFLALKQLPDDESTAKSTNAKAAPATPSIQLHDAKVFWSHDEWRIFALALHRSQPALDCLHSPDLAGLRIVDLIEAGKMMQPGRERSFAACSETRKKLLKVYAEARASRDPLFFPAAPVVAKAETVEPEASVLDQVVAQPAAATEPLPAAPVEAMATSEKRVQWTKTEWVAVAAEVARKNPHAHWPESSTLKGMKSIDVRDAQIVLPAERRRKNLQIVAFSTMRKSLLEAYKSVRQQLEAEKQQQKQRQEAIDAAAAEATAKAIAAIVPEVSEWEAAFKPMISLVFRELVAQLRPMVLEAVQAMQPPKTPSLPFLPPARPAPDVVAVPPVAKGQPLPHIGIVGNRNSYADELRKEFPQMRFTCIDTADKIDSVKSCIKVICLTRFISHSTDKTARRVAGERYVPITGSVSDMKRVLTGWLAEGILPIREIAH